MQREGVEKHQKLAEQVAARFSVLPEVEAVALAGSSVCNTTDSEADVDIYVYSQIDILPEIRHEIASGFSEQATINDFWGPGNEWFDPETGIHVDVMFWTVDWIEEQLDRVLVRHQARVGYSTCFWYTVRQSRMLFDRKGWFQQLQVMAQQPYPEPLVHAIIANNYPILRDNPSAYLHQLEKAVRRGDLVSVNHRVAAFLASYFDIVFAVNRLPHPGEKRLLTYAEKHCPKLPPGVRQQIESLIHASVGEGIGGCLMR